MIASKKLALALGFFAVFVANYLFIRMLDNSTNIDERLEDNTFQAPNVANITSNVTNISQIIPKILHQSYKSTNLPPNFKVWREECIKLNPDWQFKIWTDEDNLQLVEEHYPELLELYHSYDRDIKRIDMVRFLYLHKFGGLYMDLDMTCLKQFGTLFDQYHGFVIASQLASGKEYANAFMASPPGTKLLDYVLDWLPAFKDKSVIKATGPEFITRFLHSRSMAFIKDHWTALPFELIYAQESNKREKCNSLRSCRDSFPSAFTVSLWTATWLGGDTNSIGWKEE